MTNKKRILAVIPARGGSKRIPDKNIIPFCGHPLITWTIRAALQSKEIERVIVSTDCARIAKIATDAGADVPFLRPPEFATDEASGFSPVIHAVQTLTGYDTVVYLQPTSPLRNSRDISGALELMQKANADGVESLVAVHTHPNWMRRIRTDRRVEWLSTEPPAERSQDLPPVYALHGAIFAVKVSELLKHGTLHVPDTVGFVMPRERSVDIDTMADLLLAEYYFAHTSEVQPREGEQVVKPDLAVRKAA